MTSWSSAALGEITRVVGGTTPPTSHAENYGGDVVWVTPVDLGQLREPEIKDSARTITDGARIRSGLDLLPVGTVVMSSRAPIGYLGVAKVPLCTNQGCKSFVPGPRINSWFLYYALRFQMPHVRALGAGATFAEVSKTDLERFEISFPPLMDQRRIANELTEQLAQVESARNASSTRLQAERWLRSRAYELSFRGQVPFSSSPALREAPRGWAWHTLTDLARLETGHTPSRNRPDWWGGDIPWIALADIRRLDGEIAFETVETTNAEGISNSSARVLPADTVVLSRTASVGFVARMGRPMATSQDFVNWVCGPDLDPEFLMHLLIRSRDEIRALSSGAIHKTVYFPTVKAFRVCVPASGEQRRIAEELRERLAAIDAVEASVRAERDAIEALPAALLRRAFEDLAA